MECDLDDSEDERLPAAPKKTSEAEEEEDWEEEEDPVRRPPDEYPLRLLPREFDRLDDEAEDADDEWRLLLILPAEDPDDTVEDVDREWPPTKEDAPEEPVEEEVLDEEEEEPER